MFADLVIPKSKSHRIVVHLLVQEQVGQALTARREGHVAVKLGPGGNALSYVWAKKSLQRLVGIGWNRRSGIMTFLSFQIP